MCHWRLTRQSSLLKLLKINECSHWVMTFLFLEMWHIEFVERSCLVFGVRGFKGDGQKPVVSIRKIYK